LHWSKIKVEQENKTEEADNTSAMY